MLLSFICGKLCHPPCMVDDTAYHIVVVYDVEDEVYVVTVAYGQGIITVHFISNLNELHLKKKLL